jgi:hypothetical protein
LREATRTILEKSFFDIAVKNADVSKLYGCRVVAGRIHRSGVTRTGEGPAKEAAFQCPVTWGVPVVSSCETAVRSCAGGNGFVIRMLFGTP